MYGDIGQGQMVGPVTKQHIITAGYLIENKPSTQPRSPINPAAGMTEPPIGEMEQYARKVRAIHNPFVALHDLQMGTLSPDTINAVAAVYPSMYMDMQASMLETIGNMEEPLTRKQQMQLDIFFGNTGSVYAQYAPKFMARINTINQEAEEAQAAKQATPSRQGMGGGSNPSLSQSMRTTSQRLANSGNA